MTKRLVKIWDPEASANTPKRPLSFNLIGLKEYNEKLIQGIEYKNID